MLLVLMALLGIFSLVLTGKEENGLNVCLHQQAIKTGGRVINHGTEES